MYMAVHVVVFCCIWLYMAVYGFILLIWLYMAVYMVVLAVFGCLWLSMAVYGDIWLCMAVYGDIWLYAVFWYVILLAEGCCQYMHQWCPPSALQRSNGTHGFLM